MLVVSSQGGSGDSYTSTGFNVHGPQPNAGNPLGNPAYPGATSSNGPNYVDFMSSTYNQSYIQTYSFGYGGATIDPTLVASPLGLIVQSFEQQVTESFLPLYTHGQVPWSAGNTLFTIFFGINDVMLSYLQQNSSLNYALIKDYERLVNQVSCPCLLSRSNLVILITALSYMPQVHEILCS